VTERYNPAKRKRLSQIDGGGGCGAHDTTLAAAATDEASGVRSRPGAHDTTMAAAEENAPVKKNSKGGGKQLGAPLAVGAGGATVRTTAAYPRHYYALSGRTQKNWRHRNRRK
jgi:hypothetical protein